MHIDFCILMDRLSSYVYVLCQSYQEMKERIECILVCINLCD